MQYCCEAYRPHSDWRTSDSLRSHSRLLQPRGASVKYKRYHSQIAHIFADFIEGKLPVKDRSGFHQLLDSHITWVIAVFLRHLDISSPILRQIIECVAGTGRNSIDIRKLVVLIHQIIQYPSCINSAESTAFQNQSSLIQTPHFLSHKESLTSHLRRSYQ